MLELSKKSNVPHAFRPFFLKILTLREVRDLFLGASIYFWYSKIHGIPSKPQTEQ